MDQEYPIYTVETECQDCYKCVRHCPVKAIYVEQGHAKVRPELCVACGKCVAVCPAHAKSIRNDLGRVKHLLSLGRPIYVSLAPSWISEFPNTDAGKLIHALHRLGFKDVSETALGAQEVSTVVAKDLAQARSGLFLSSACPVAVRYVEKYLPDLADSITKLLSPALAHARLLRKTYGEGIGVVFIGPCIAKKNEADEHPDLLDMALTFSDLRTWFQEAQVDLYRCRPAEEDHFVPQMAEEGSLYPVEGGMIETIRKQGEFKHVHFSTLTGVANIQEALEGFKTRQLANPIFIEALSCEGGCVNGPCISEDEAVLLRRLRVENYTKMPECQVQRTASVAIEKDYEASPVLHQSYEEPLLREALRSVGKASVEDELNCGGCGYDTCREFAYALMEGKAEPTMCVSYMRNLAQKKANALLRSMPSGVVVVDRDMCIVECNEIFARLFGEDNMAIYEVCPGMKGCKLSKVIPFSDMFRQVLKTGHEYHNEHYRYEELLYSITIFSIEPHEVVGAVIQDVTRQELRRDQIAQRANEVIKRNLSTVQEIACRLGEHMADTEILLRSIAEGYGSEEHPPRGRSK